MSQEIGSLHYDVDIDDRKLKGGLDSADKAVSSFGDRVGKMGEQMQTGLRDAAKVLAVTSVGLTAFAKSATDFTENFVKQSKMMGQQIGVSTTEASRLTAAFGRMGIEADNARQMFGIFSKNIVEATKNADQNRLAHEKLTIEIDKTQAAIKTTTDEINKNGDKTGQLSIKLRELNNTLATQKDALNQSSDAFQKLGISTVDANGKQKDFNTILFEVADKFKAMPDGIDKTALSMELFGRQGKDMIKVLDLGSQGIQELEKQADKLGLTLNPNTIAAVEGLVRSQKDLKQQTDALKIAVGTATAPVLTKFNEKINELTQSLLAVKEPFHSITINTLAFGGPITGAASGVAAFLGNISSISPKLLSAARGFSILSIGALAIAGAGYEIYKNWDKIGPAFQRVGNYLSGVFSPAISLVKETFKAFKDAVMAIVAAVMQNLGPALVQLVDAFKRLWDAINPAFTVGLKVLAALIAGVLVAAIWLFLSALNVGIQIFSMVVSAISNVINWFSNFIGWIGTAAVAVAGAVSSMAQWFLQLPQHAARAVNGIISAIAGAASWLVSAGVNIIMGLVNGMGSAVGAIWSTLGRIVQGIIGWFAGAIGWLIGGGINVIMGLINGIGGALGSLWARLSSVVSGIINWFAGAGGWLVNAGSNIVRGLINGITGAAGGITSALIGALHKAQSAVWDFWGAFVDAGWGLIRALASGIKNAAGEAVNAAKNVLQKVRNLLPFSDAKEGPLSDLTLSGTRFSKTFAKGILDGADAIHKAVSSSLVSPMGVITGNMSAAINSPTPAFAGAGSGGVTNNQQTTHQGGDTYVEIGTINDRQDVDYLLSQMNRDTQLQSMGISPAKGGL